MNSAKAGIADVIVGLDYGDEGKGRIVDIKLASGKYQIVVRFNGGNNAGHTIILPDGRKVILNSIPSGILHPEITNYIASGCVVDPVHLIYKEIPQVKEFIKSPDQLKISANASAITPIHILWDSLTGALVGTTGKGIGPAYADKARRAEGDTIRNLKLADIIYSPQKAKNILLKHFAELLSQLKTPEYQNILIAYCAKNKIEWRNINQDDLVHKLAAEIKIEEKIDRFVDATLQLNSQGFIEKDDLWLTKEVENGKNVLMEGAQAYGLDVTTAPTPFSTSSNTFAGNAFVGGDLSPKYHNKITGVIKLITSRVGAGPFVGEFGGRESEKYCDIKNDNGEALYNKEYESSLYNADEMLSSDNTFSVGIGLRMKTGEYGATTGRPRRIGQIDTVRIGAAARKSGVDELYVTKADCMSLYNQSGLFNKQVPIITGYELNGHTINYIPSTSEELYDIKPKTINLPSFDINVEHAQSKDLPPEALLFIGFLQEKTRCKIAALGVGPGRDEMVYLKTA